MNRRELLVLALAAPVVAKAKWSETPPPKRARAPRDSNDRKYDEWLDHHYGKDEMHL